jgi:hypothetical protein
MEDGLAFKKQCRHSRGMALCDWVFRIISALQGLSRMGIIPSHDQDFFNARDGLRVPFWLTQPSRKKR